MTIQQRALHAFQAFWCGVVAVGLVIACFKGDVFFALGDAFVLFWCGSNVLDQVLLGDRERAGDGVER